MNACGVNGGEEQHAKRTAALRASFRLHGGQRAAPIMEELLRDRRWGQCALCGGAMRQDSNRQVVHKGACKEEWLRLYWRGRRERLKTERRKS